MVGYIVPGLHYCITLSGFDDKMKRERYVGGSLAPDVGPVLRSWRFVNSAPETVGGDAVR